MKNLLKCVSGFCAVMALGLTAANAQTIANGPYYATPSWDQTLPAATRFVVLANFNNEAVLDRETGLVWARSPAPYTGGDTWHEASRWCFSDAKYGNRKGWRLPTIQELFSLVDPSVAANSVLALPAGHPFTDVQTTTYYWSVTAYGTSPYRYAVKFEQGGVAAYFGSGDPYNQGWCVRGGEAVDAQ